MESVNQYIPATGLSRTIGGVVFLAVSAYLLYLLYTYFFLANVSGGTQTTLITTPMNAKVTQTTPLYSVPPPYEGGEYSVSFWTYVTAFKDQLGTNKHILEIRGAAFSTLVVGLDAFSNKLLVRAHTGTSSSGTAGSNNIDLSTSNVKTLFTTTTVPSGLMADSLPLCDLPEFDLQRWVNVSIVLNGRTCDVYMDGKLARSCVLPSFYKVDSNGVSVKLLDFGGFNGFLSDVNCYQYAINPDQAYRIYMAGPTQPGGSGLLSWLKSIFNIEGSVSVSYPTVGVSYPSTTINF